MIALAGYHALCHAAAMTTPTPRAGGFFLILPIVIGFGVGIAVGEAMAGALIGLGLGLVLAALLWLLDRRPGPH